MKKQGSGWKGESRRHSLARKGVKTNLPDGRRFDVSNFVANGNYCLNKDGVYKFKTAEEVLKALKEGHEVMVKGYGEDPEQYYDKDDDEYYEDGESEYYTAIYYDDWKDEFTDEEILKFLKEDYWDWELWNLKASGKPNVETIFENQLKKIEQFKVGKFNWFVDGKSVIVTKDTPDGLFENIAHYEYKNFTEASDNAYRMAVKQANSGRN